MNNKIQLVPALFAMAFATGCMAPPTIDTTPAFDPPPIRTEVAPRSRDAIIGTWKGSSVLDKNETMSRMITRTETIQTYESDGTFRFEVNMTTTTTMITASAVARAKTTYQNTLPPIISTGTWKYENGFLHTVSYNEHLKKTIESTFRVAWYGDDEIEILMDEAEREKAVDAGLKAGRAAIGDNGQKTPDVKLISKRSRDERGVTTETFFTMVDGKQVGEPSTWVSTPNILSRVRQ